MNSAFTTTVPCIVSHCTGLGLVNLPNILWRKQTNAPNKFMGSGMLPCGAYVTLEHEWIPIFRKGGKRMYRTDEEKSTRRQSGYFWEERNCWFFRCMGYQRHETEYRRLRDTGKERLLPLDIPFRLINMYSQHGDMVLDPFAGLCTTNIAAIINGRNSIGIEIDRALESCILDNIESYTVESRTES